MTSTELWAATGRTSCVSSARSRPVPEPPGTTMTEPLPHLLDAKKLAAELGVTRAAAEAIMRQLPIVQVPDLRKVYVKRGDVEALLVRSTYDKSEVPAWR